MFTLTAKLETTVQDYASTVVGEKPLNGSGAVSMNPVDISRRPAEFVVTEPGVLIQNMMFLLNLTDNIYRDVIMLKCREEEEENMIKKVSIISNRIIMTFVLVSLYYNESHNTR